MRQLPAIIASIEPGLLVRTSLLSDRLRRGASESIRVTTLLGVFGTAALLLSALSLYALVSYSTARKLREFAIRHALGSTPARVVWLAMRGGLRPLLAGVALGLAAALALGKSFALLVPQARSFDPFIFGVVALTLATTGCLAILVPALRAVRVSLPLALKCE